MQVLVPSLFGLSALLIAQSAMAIPELLPVQGYLTDTGGSPISGAKSITLKLYDVASGGTALHVETQTATVSQGYFTIFLGTAEDLDLTLFRDYAEIYVGIAVNTSPGDGTEFVPRLPLGTSPFAAFSLNAAYDPTESGMTATDVQAAIDELSLRLDTFIDSKAAANGIASLDSNTRVPVAQLGSGTASSSTYLRGDSAWVTQPAPIAHASSHKNGGADEVATATSAANAIPKAGSGGQLSPAWLGTGTASSSTYLRGDGSWVTQPAPTSHATSHQNGGADEVATATSSANAIPKAGAGGQLSPAWLGSGTASSSLT